VCVSVYSGKWKEARVWEGAAVRVAIRIFRVRRVTRDGKFGKQPEIHLPQFEKPATTTCVNANERENANILIDF